MQAPRTTCNFSARRHHSTPRRRELSIDMAVLAVKRVDHPVGISTPPTTRIGWIGERNLHRRMRLLAFRLLASTPYYRTPLPLFLVPYCVHIHLDPVVVPVDVTLVMAAPLRRGNPDTTPLDGWVRSLVQTYPQLRQLSLLCMYVLVTPAIASVGSPSAFLSYGAAGQGI
jgi:hypothetical protein